MTGIACYVRTSTEDQGGGLATQRAECTRYCQQHGLAAPVFYEDEVTGTTRIEDRPGAARLLEDARAGRVRKLVTFKLDRLARSTLVTLSAIQALEAAGVEIACAAEPFDSATPAGKLLITVLASVAEMERETIVMRTSAGLRNKTREGGWSGGRAPFGYRLADKRILVDEGPEPASGLAPAEVVRRIFAWIAEGVSSRVVAARLDGLGIPAPDGGRGGLWSDSTVRRIVKNTLYRGVRRWGRRTRVKGRELAEGTCPAVVTAEVWAAAQAGLVRNFTLAKRNCRREYLLRGLVRCAACGRRYSGTTSSGNRVYVCTRRRDGCRALAVRADELEAAIWGDIETFVRAPGQVLDELARQQAQGREGTAFAARRAKALKRQLALKGQERGKVITLHRRGSIAEDEAVAQLDALRREQEALAADIARLEDVDARAREHEARLRGAAGLLADLGRRLDAGPSFGVRRQIVEALVDTVEITTSGHRVKRRIDVAVAYAFTPSFVIAAHTSSPAPARSPASDTRAAVPPAPAR